MAAITFPEDPTSCCRTCLNGASTNMYDIFDDREDHFSVAKMMVTCTAIQVEANEYDRFPKKICRSCYHNLMSFYDFKKLAEDIDQKLHKHFSNRQLEVPIKNEIKGNDPDDNEAIPLINDFDDFVVKNETLNFSDDSMPLAQYTDEENNIQLINNLPELSKKKTNTKKVKRKRRLKWTIDIEQQQLYTCTLCSQKFKYHTSYIKHIEKHDPSEENDIVYSDLVPCDMCSERFRSQNSLAAHKRIHVLKGRILACKVCGKVFKKVSHLKRHELCHEDRPFKCSECSRSFLTEALLLEHRDYKHKGIRPFPCPICAKGFAHQAVLSNHIKIHMRERPYLCPTCGKRFESSTNLKQHISRHVGVRMFECDRCPKKFVTKGELKSHRNTHLGVKAYGCEQCGAAYTKSSSLKKHMLTHLGVKAFQCESCPRKFTLKHQLTVHTRIHTGEKPYKCELCERAFTQSGDLLKHKRAHFGNELYRCDECGDCFRLKALLQAHISEHYLNSKAIKDHTNLVLEENTITKA